jgi:hypothetical protein
MSRWIRFVIAIVVGIVLGLLYGWVVNPVEYVDTIPESLREDYKADYVLMVAETYQLERDPSLAAARLMFLGDSPPVSVVEETLTFAEDVGYSPADIAVLSRLYEALQIWWIGAEAETP